MKRNLLRCLLLLLVFASLPACIVDGRGRFYSPFYFGHGHGHGHSHGHCR